MFLPPFCVPEDKTTLSPKEVPRRTAKERTVAIYLGTVHRVSSQRKSKKIKILALVLCLASTVYDGEKSIHFVEGMSVEHEKEIDALSAPEKAYANTVLRGGSLTLDMLNGMEIGTVGELRAGGAIQFRVVQVVDDNNVLIEGIHGLIWLEVKTTGTQHYHR